MNGIEVTCVEYRKKYPGRRILFVDTPGFDDTERSDMEVLEIIGDWLKNTCVPSNPSFGNGGAN
jgi:predicted GTPase